jgi:hypothetical protein
LPFKAALSCTSCMAPLALAPPHLPDPGWCSPSALHLSFLWFSAQGCPHQRSLSRPPVSAAPHCGLALLLLWQHSSLCNYLFNSDNQWWWQWPWLTSIKCLLFTRLC